MIKCPYCLKVSEPILQEKGNSTIYICTNNECGIHIHRDFIEKKDPRMTIGLVGFTGHGKTVYLTALFYLLKHLRRVNNWERFTWQTLDDNTHKIMFEHVNEFEEKSKLPDSTPENFPHPALIEFDNIPIFGTHFISFYDTAGRVFKEAEKITETGRFVAHSDVVLFIISIKDCGNSPANKMEEFLDTYIDAVYNRLRIDLKKQHLIIVLSKADELEFSRELNGFLYDGSYRWYNTQENLFRSKIKELQRTSRKIKDWLEENGCGGFVKLAKKRFKSCEYTIISSTGAKPVGNQLAAKLNPEDPKRVLDPFLLALYKMRSENILWEILWWIQR